MPNLVLTAEALSYMLDLDSSVEVTGISLDTENGVVFLVVEDPEETLKIYNDEWHYLEYGTDSESGVVILKRAVEMEDGEVDARV